MPNRELLIEKHNVIKETIFSFKAFALTAARGIKNVLNADTRFSKTTGLSDDPLLATSQSELWTTDDNEQNWILTAGKIENLPIASRNINGIVVPAGAIFSFWKHIGKPAKRRGYVTGREIREGCIIPTIAGGLCQLSNALYDAALTAGFEIIERHKHTRVIKGSLAEIDRDATVKWNYLDLRFRAPFTFRIEAELSSDKLTIRFRGTKTTTISKPVFVLQPSAKLNDCYSCGNYSCFKHPGEIVTRPKKSITTFLLDERWPEYDDYIKQRATPRDTFVVPFLSNRLVKISRFIWTCATTKRSVDVPLTALYRGWYLRQFAKKKNVFSIMLKLDKTLALRMARAVPVECTHLVVSQNLLPFLWESGVFGGRTFEVLMTRLPIEILHQRLDDAFARYPQSKTLHDFRAPDELIVSENKALTKAQKIITPHRDIAALFKNKVVTLSWHIPSPKKADTGANKILFPASAVGRKGSYEVRQLVREMNVSLVLLEMLWKMIHFGMVSRWRNLPQTCSMTLS